MKNKFLWLFLAGCMLTFLSCGEKDVERQDLLIGNWKATKVVVTAYDANNKSLGSGENPNVDQSINFKKDGTVDSGNAHGQWKLDNKKIIFTSSDGVEEMQIHQISQSNLVLSMDYTDEVFLQESGLPNGTKRANVKIFYKKN